MTLAVAVDREAYDRAAALLAEYGLSALAEATTRAARSRALGNHIHYARWCSVGRTILMIEDPEAHGALH